MSFESSVAKWTKGTAEDTAEFFREVTFELFSSVAMDTPVDTGRLRGNWIPTTGSPATGTTEEVDPSGSVTVAIIKRKVDGEILPREDFDLFLTNNLPYAAAMENGGSKKSPEGMVRRNFIRVSENLK